jgi:hypothetical protein
MTPETSVRVAILKRPWKPDARCGWLPAARAARRWSSRLWCCKRKEKVAKIVGERMKLEPHGVGRERPARQPCPLDRALSLIHCSHVPRLLWKATTRSAGRNRLATMKPTRG